MPLLTKPSKAAHMAVLYITIGAIMAVWAAVSYIYLQQQNLPTGDGRFYWCYGFFFTGMALLIIGITLGRIGRSARVAELPPAAPSTPTAEPANPTPTVAGNGQPAVPKVTPASTTTPATPPVAASPPSVR